MKLNKFQNKKHRAVFNNYFQGEKSQVFNKVAFLLIFNNDYLYFKKEALIAKKKAF